MPRVAQGQASYETNTTAFTAALPLSGSNNVQPGDVVLFTITTTSSTATTLTPAGSSGSLFPSGVGSSDACQSQGWYWVLPDPVPASVVVNCAAARQGSLVWAAYRGVDTSSPMDAPPIPGNQQASSTNSPVMPSITTVTPGATVVGGICHGSGSTTVTGLPSPWTLVEDGTRRNGLLFEKGAQAVPGPSGSATFTLSGAQQSRVWTAALRPAASEPADPPVVADLTSEPYPGFTGDIADGAAIIRNPADPAASVVIVTNKDVGGGLYVLGLDGQIRSSRLDGAANSVDWRDWDGRILVATTDREDSLMRFYWLNWATNTLTPAGQSSALGWEPYGSCLYKHSDGTVYAFVTQRGPDDTSPRNFYQYPLTRNGDTVTMGAAVRTVGTSSVVEGLAADDITGGLFASEENVGLYRYSAAPIGGTTRTTVDTVGAGNLVADVEDVAVSRTSAGAWLLVSSQGDSSYHVYDLATFEHVQRFTIARPDGSDQVTSTDGLDFLLADLGASFPNGLIVVHDGDRLPVSDFAFVDAEPVFGVLPASDVRSGSSVASVTVATTGTGRKRVRRSSTTGVELTTTGVGKKHAAGASVSGVEASTVGSGASARSGSSAAPVEASAVGAGVSVRRGSSVSSVSVTATGSGRRVESGRGSSVATVTVETTGAGMKVARGSSVARIDVTATGTGQRVEAGRGSSVTTVLVDTTGTGYARRTGDTVTTVTVTTRGSGRNPAGPDDIELTIARGPYGHPFRVGSPRGHTFTVSSPRR